MLFCPDHTVQNVSAAALDANWIVDAEDRDRLTERIQ
jgi:hypothetical protein